MKSDVSWLCLVAIIGLIILALVVAVLAMQGYFETRGELDREGNLSVEIEVGERNQDHARLEDN